MYCKHQQGAEIPDELLAEISEANRGAALTPEEWMELLKLLETN